MNFHLRESDDFISFIKWLDETPMTRWDSDETLLTRWVWWIDENPVTRWVYDECTMSVQSVYIQCTIRIQQVFNNCKWLRLIDWFELLWPQKKDKRKKGKVLFTIRFFVEHDFSINANLKWVFDSKGTWVYHDSSSTLY